MDKRTILKEEFLQLRAEFHALNPEAQKLFVKKISAFLKDKTPEEKNLIAEIMTECIDEDIREVQRIRQEVEITPDGLNTLQKALFDLSNDIKETAIGLSIN